VIEIPVDIRDQMIAHARAGLPNESCGFLAGTDGQVTKLYPVRNEETEQPRIRYVMHSGDQLHAQNDIDDRGLQVVAIYHSHPEGPPHPSSTDRNRAFLPDPTTGERFAVYPDAAYVIVSLDQPGDPSVRAFQLESDAAHEVDVVFS
jgi:proteasome lid subunit RPN8/RPN11